MPTKAATPTNYLKALPGERREALEAVRAVIRKNLPKGYEEGIQYGMIGYFVPHSLHPAGYHCNPKEPLPFAHIASQKHHLAIYLFCIYCDPALTKWFRSAWKKTGKKLDMGKSCIRFRKVDDLALDVLGQVIKKVPVKKFVAFYEDQLKNRPQRKRAAKKKSNR